ncbi:MAG: TlpA family protein disulfide reductase [Alphaproteobacteria bacterium]|nr:MAG: TlpA family protein disulfide reductase [Alphaproteobacteria bacterium]
MPRKALLIPVIILVVALFGAAAYRAIMPGTTADAPINSYLKGEMAKLTLPDGELTLTDHMIQREDGSAAPLSAMKGKALLINLWASWCAPCRAEMPELANLQKELGDDRFEVVAINVGRGGIPEAREILAEWGVAGLNLYAEPTMKIAFDLADSSLPTSLIVGADGRVRAKFLGPLKWDGPEALELFEALKNGEI